MKSERNVVEPWLECFKNQKMNCSAIACKQGKLADSMGPQVRLQAGWSMITLRAELGGTLALRHKATAPMAWHCACTSRAQSSQRPHCVATPSSHCSSANVAPPCDILVMSRSETRWQTQMIMVRSINEMRMIRKCIEENFEVFYCITRCASMLKLSGLGARAVGASSNCMS